MQPAGATADARFCGLAPVWVALLTAMHRISSALLPSDEEARMQAVHRYHILDSPTDGAFDRIPPLAARLFSVPVAIVSVVDHEIWFKSHFGTDVDQIGRDPGLCASAILQQDAWVVSDAPTLRSYRDERPRNASPKPPPPGNLAGDSRRTA